MKSFEDQRNGENIENILNSKTEKAVILFETAIGTEEDTNMTMFYINNNSQKSKIKAIIGEEEKNEYCEVSIIDNNVAVETFYVSCVGTVLDKNAYEKKFYSEKTAISRQSLLESVGIDIKVINDLQKNQENKKIEINYNDKNEPVKYFKGTKKQLISELQDLTTTIIYSNPKLSGSSVRSKANKSKLMALVGLEAKEIKPGEIPGTTPAKTNQGTSKLSHLPGH